MAITRTIILEWRNPLVQARLKDTNNPFHHIYQARRDAGLADGDDQVVEIDEHDDGSSSARFYPDLNAHKTNAYSERRDIAADDNRTITNPDA